MNDITKELLTKNVEFMESEIVSLNDFIARTESILCKQKLDKDNLIKKIKDLKEDLNK